MLWLIAGALRSWRHQAAHRVPRFREEMFPTSVAGDPAGALPRRSSCAFARCWWMTRSRNGRPENHTPLLTAGLLFAAPCGLNDALPGDKIEHWIWQRGPWLMVDRVKGSVTALHLPDYDPAVSNVVWFRRLCCVLRADGQRQATVCRGRADRGAQAGDCKKTVSVVAGGKPAAGLRGRGVAARSAAGYVSTDGRGRGQLRPGWAFRCAGGRRRWQREPCLVRSN